MTMPEGRLHNPDHPSQEVLANGASCGNAIRVTVGYWLSQAPRFGGPGFTDPERGVVSYPNDYFGPDDDPIMSPITEATMAYGAEDLPILAWAVAPHGGEAAVVVDMMERPRRPGREGEAGDPVTYADCKVITGTPSEVLPREIRELLRLR
jgi:hypothetical protein